MALPLLYEYTFDHHFKFGFEPNRYFERRQGPEDIFIASYGRAQFCPLNWREANVLAAKEIFHRLPQPLWVLFSGGTDSEACLRSFSEAKVPVKIASLKLKKGYNQHDLDYVRKYSDKYSCEVEVIELDIEEFWESREFYRIVDSIECVSPILAAHLWLADQLVGTPILAQGEPHLKKEIDQKAERKLDSWYLVESERLCSLYTHFIKTKKPAVPGFFQYMPEQTLSFLKNNPLLHDLVNNRIFGKLGTRSSKNQMVRQFYPEIEERPKFTGFEKISFLHDLKRSELAERFPHSDAIVKIDYEDLLSQLEPLVKKEENKGLLLK
ncbi:MAG: hypothetical protein KDD35_06395 [Bdellovibrionales bacterium]|nr:hypothetical protein [Bdellovibrionales bacterium]